MSLLRKLTGLPAGTHRACIPLGGNGGVVPFVEEWGPFPVTLDGVKVGEGWVVDVSRDLEADEVFIEVEMDLL